MRHPFAVILLLLTGVLACGSGTRSAESSLTALTGSVIARSEGFSSRPGWAEPGRAWSREGDALVVVGYAGVRGDQNKEMAFRASDSYARAELLQFLTVRVVAILLDEETSGAAASAEDRRTLEERVATHSEAVVDNWLVSSRYWEKRERGDRQTLHVFSRLEVDRARVEELLATAAQGSSDLRLSHDEISRRLSGTWERIAEISELEESERELLPGVRPPDWAAAGDGDTDAGFSFVCHARASDQKTAEALAKARCNEKLCRLFGVRISARTTIKETLDTFSAENEVTEQCAEVRAAGRKATNKSAECTEEGCIYWLRQTYPRAAYEAELERQKEPTVIRQQVVIQEGGIKYRDPAQCERSLRDYAAVKGQRASAYQARLKHLNASLRSCQGIDGRDSGLFTSMSLLLTKSTDSFLFKGGRDSRGAFASVSEAWEERLATERFLVTRIQMVRDVVRDAVFPIQLSEAAAGSEVSDVAFEKLVKKLVTIPLTDDSPIPTHRKSPHSILLGYYSTQRPSPTYRAFLLRALKGSTFSCDGSDIIDAERIANYLRREGGGVDDEEYAALLRAFKRAPGDEMNRCIAHLISGSKRNSVRSRRVRELAALAVDRTLRFGDRVVNGERSPPNANVGLFEFVLLAAEPAEMLDLYSKYQGRLVGTQRSLDDLAKKVAKALFGGMRGTSSVREKADVVRHCRSLVARYRAARARGLRLPITSTDTCECLRLDELRSKERAELVELWASKADRRCRHFRIEEWPGGHIVWTAKRHGDAPNGSPFRYPPKMLYKEYNDCSRGAGIFNLDFIPMLKATLIGGELRGIAISVQLEGEISRMKKRGDPTALVRQPDVFRAREKFAACFQAAAEGYDVDSELRERPTGPRRVWLEFSGQGISHGYE